MSEVVRSIAALTTLLFWVACGPGTDRSVDRRATTAIVLQDAANATYEGIYEDPVTLEDGRWIGEPFAPQGAARPALTLIDKLWMNGDLDGDDRDEAIVLLAEGSGGSGSYLYIAVLGHRGDGIANLGTALVGDRVQVRAMHLTDTGVALDVVQQGPEDAACCPTQKATRTWVLEGDGLSERPPRLTGELSIADLEGTEWVLTHLAPREPTPPDPKLTLIVEDGLISGSAGCNRYFSSLAEPAPGELEVGGLGSTRMVCPERLMDLETTYLEALQGVTGFRFLAGQLALTYRNANGLSTLLFDPRQP